MSFITSHCSEGARPSRPDSRDESKHGSKSIFVINYYFFDWNQKDTLTAKIVAFCHKPS